jgi:hypothetical protein
MPQIRISTSTAAGWVAYRVRIASIRPPSLLGFIASVNFGAAARRARRSAAVSAVSALRPSLSRTSPAGVNVTERLVRSNSRTPILRSSRWMVLDSGGCAIPSRLAARPKFSSSATATK